MKFHYHEDYLLFNEQLLQLRKNGSFWRRRKDHYPVMRLYNNMGPAKVCILLDKILPSNPKIAHGMVFIEGAFGKKISLNIEQFVSRFDYKLDMKFKTNYKMSRHLVYSLKYLNYIAGENKKEKDISTIDDADDLLVDFVDDHFIDIDY